jgi:hypothetical protein
VVVVPAAIQVTAATPVTPQLEQPPKQVLAVAVAVAEHEHVDSMLLVEAAPAAAGQECSGKALAVAPVSMVIQTTRQSQVTAVAEDLREVIRATHRAA